MAFDYPAYGQSRASNELRKQGIFISAGGVRSVWQRHDLEIFDKRLKRLEARMAEEGLVLTEAQQMAVERKKERRESFGEIETEHPGYLGSQDTYYVGNIKGVGRIYQQTFIDTYSRVAFAKLYETKHAITSADILNDRVLPFFDKSYPLYIQVTYNRKNMQLRSRYAEYYYSVDDVQPEMIAFEERVISKIITYEAGKFQGEYDLKGLRRKYDVYSFSIHEAVEIYLKTKLRLAILKTKDELATVLNFSTPQATVARLHEAARRLFKDFDHHLGAKLASELTSYEQFRELDKQPFLSYTFPTLIDWMDGSYQEEFTSKLNGVYKNRPDVVKQVLSLVQHAIAEKLKGLEE